MNTDARRRRAVGSAFTVGMVALLGACTTEPLLAPATTQPLNAPAFDVVPGVAYEIVDLGTLGGTGSIAQAINDAKEVVGWSWTATGRLHAFLWQDGVMTDMGTLGGPFSQADAINDNGEVVGSSNTATFFTFPFRWQNGVMTSLGTASGRARAINNAGQVAGFFLTGGQTHAFRWKDGVMTDLGTLGGAFSEAKGINDAGQVVGWSYTAAGRPHAFLWEEGVMLDLGTLGGTFSEAWGINEAGQVVGRSGTATGEVRGFLWENGVMTDLGTLGGGNSHAFAINNAGQVAGSAHTETRLRAFLWQGGVMTDLGTLGGLHSSAQAINDDGQVVGWALTPTGRQHAVLWRVSDAQDDSDISPPAIIPSIAGTPGSNGWYTSNVTVSWSVTDDESAVGSTSGCETSIVATDTRGQSFTCTATSEGGEASERVIVRRDASSPEISFSGATEYTVDEDVAIACSAADPTSGIATQSCPGASGPGYTFTLGTHTLNANAVNNAGLGASASTSFTVGVTFASSIVLTRRFVTHAGNANSLEQKLVAAAAADERGNENSKRAALRAYVNEIEALTGRSISAEHAAILIRLANAL